QCMNNNKDVPFASAYAASVFYIASFASSGAPSRAAALKALVAIGSAIAIRVGGLLFVGYLLEAVALWTICERSFTVRHVVRTAAVTAIVSVGAILFGDLFCPWALDDPFVRPFEALAVFAHFPAERTRVLFEGHVFAATKLPLSYIPV